MSLLSVLFYLDDALKHVGLNHVPRKFLTEIKDIVYDDTNDYLDKKGNKTGLLDIIYDEKQKGKIVEGKYPVFLNIHGGGWIEGDKSMRRGLCQHMAMIGGATINVSYCLGPKYTFPDYMRQLYKLLQWVVANAEKYSFDLDNIVLCGDSAGGHLCAELINCQAHKEYREHLGLPDVDIKFKGVILNCPAINFEGKIINLPIVRTMTYHATGIKNYKKLKTEYPYYEELQVHHGVTADYPRLFLNNGFQDVFTNSGSKLLRKALDEKGVKYEYYMAYEPFNSFHDYNLKYWMPNAWICLKKEKDFLLRVWQNK